MFLKSVVKDPRLANLFVVVVMAVCYLRGSVSTSLGLIFYFMGKVCFAVARREIGCIRGGQESETALLPPPPGQTLPRVLSFDD